VHESEAEKAAAPRDFFTSSFEFAITVASLSLVTQTWHSDAVAGTEFTSLALQFFNA